MSVGLRVAAAVCACTLLGGRGQVPCSTACLPVIVHGVHELISNVGLTPRCQYWCLVASVGVLRHLTEVVATVMVVVVVEVDIVRCGGGS